MASPSQLIFIKSAAADIPTPATGRVAFFTDSATGFPSFKDDTGAVFAITGATLTALAGLVGAADKVPYFTGPGAAALADFPAAARTLLAAVSAVAQRTALSVYSTAQVDAAIAAAIAGLSWKQEVRVATTAAHTLATDYENGDTIDGVVLATGDRILIKNQATGSENGIYVVNVSGAPTRATDADAGAELVNASMYVSEGTVNADTQWVCTTNAPIVVGTTALVFAQLTSGGGALSTLSDIVITAPANGDLLTYDSGSGKWKNAAPSGGAVPGWVTDSPSNAPGSPNVADDEFGGAQYPSEVALDTGGTRFASATPWAWRNQGTSTATLANGLLTITPQNNGQIHGVEQALPAGTWRYRAHVAIGTDHGATVEGGLYIIDNVSGKLITLPIAGFTTTAQWPVDEWTNVSTYSSTPASVSVTRVVDYDGWFEIEYDGTNLIFRQSRSGYEGTFSKLASVAKATWPGVAPTHIGLFGYNNGTAFGVAVCDSFRRLA